MKTKFLSLFAAVLLSQAMMAQFHLGVKAGANITKVDGKSFKDEFRYGYHLGGFAEIRLRRSKRTPCEMKRSKCCVRSAR